MTSPHTRAAIVATCRMTFGPVAVAALYEWRLAEIETRDPEQWAVEEVWSAP